MTLTKTSAANDVALSDEALVSRIQLRHGDAGTLLNLLLQRHYQSMLQRSKRYLGNWDDAQDVVQETALRVYRYIDNFRHDASFRTWLFNILDNQCHTFIAKRNRYTTVECIDRLVALSETTEAVNTIESTLERTNEVQTAMKQLAPGSRKIISLRFYQDMAIDQIAGSMNLGLSAAKMRLYRAQEQLQQVLIAA